MFTREYLLSSDWYRERLLAKQAIDIKQWQRRCNDLEEYCSIASHQMAAQRLGLRDRLEYAKKQLAIVSSHEYLKSLIGTIGADQCIHG